MRRTELYIDSERVEFTSLTTRDYVDRIGSWTATLKEIEEFNGLCKVEVKEDGSTVFQGLMEQPDKSISGAGAAMNLGGPEWTARLTHFLCPTATSIDGDNVTTSLATVYTDCPFTTGEVDTWDTELDPTVYDDMWEIIGFTYTDACVVFKPVEVIDATIATDDYEMPTPDRRAIFMYDGATPRVYCFMYDSTVNNDMRYAHSPDGENWTVEAWDDGDAVANTDGDNGEFGVYWDGSLVHILVQDGGNVDYYTGSINDTTGVITFTRVSNDFAAGGILLGPVPDSSGHIWCCIVDGADYELWEYVAGWTQMATGANIPKAMWGIGSDGDVAVIEWDSVEGDIEEYLWDRSAATYTHQHDVVTTIDGTTIGYIQMHVKYENVHIMYEDEYVGGESDLNHCFRLKNDYSWSTPEEAVDKADYDVSGNFSSFMDGAGNAFLWFQHDDGVTAAHLALTRMFEGTWQDHVDTGHTIKSGGGIHAPPDGLIVFIILLDTDDTLHIKVPTPVGLTANQRYIYPTLFSEDHEGASGYDGYYEDAGCTVSITDTSNPYSGTKNLIAECPAGIKYPNGASYYYQLGTAGSGGAVCYASAKNVRYNDALPTNGDDVMLIHIGRTTYGQSCASAGISKTGGVDHWAISYFSGAALTVNATGSAVAINTDYHIELGVYRHDTAGWVRLWVNGVLEIEVTGADTKHATDRYLDYVSWGMHFYNTHSTNTDNLIITMDDCRASIHIIDEGNERTGTVNTGQIDASGAFTSWGTLASEDVDVYNTAWKVTDDADVDLVTGLTLPADLDDEGVSSTETSIKIEVVITSKGEAETYIAEISLAENGNEISVELDAENCFIGTQKVADPLGAEFKLQYDDTVDFLDELGSDKSSYIKFFTARSASKYPDIKANVKVVSRNPDWGYYANCIKVIGATVDSVRVEATAKDTDEIVTMSERLGGSHNGEIWHVVRDPEIPTVAMAQQRANTEKALRVSLYETLNVQVEDYTDAEDLVRGDTVQLHDRWTDLDTTARVIGITKTYAGAGHKAVFLELQKRARTSDINKHIALIDDLLRYATAGGGG